jgi:hypothetical protein
MVGMMMGKDQPLYRLLRDAAYGADEIFTLSWAGQRIDDHYTGRGDNEPRVGAALGPPPGVSECDIYRRRELYHRNRGSRQAREWAGCNNREYENSAQIG